MFSFMQARFKVAHAQSKSAWRRPAGSTPASFDAFPTYQKSQFSTSAARTRESRPHCRPLSATTHIRKQQHMTIPPSPGSASSRWTYDRFEEGIRALVKTCHDLERQSTAWTADADGGWEEVKVVEDVSSVTPKLTSMQIFTGADQSCTVRLSFSPHHEARQYQ
jgi:hypothetical protein